MKKINLDKILEEIHEEKIHTPKETQLLNQDQILELLNNKKKVSDDE